MADPIEFVGYIPSPDLDLPRLVGGFNPGTQIDQRIARNEEFRGTQKRGIAIPKKGICLASCS